MRTLPNLILATLVATACDPSDPEGASQREGDFECQRLCLGPSGLMGGETRFYRAASLADADGQCRATTGQCPDGTTPDRCSCVQVFDCVPLCIGGERGDHYPGFRADDESEAVALCAEDPDIADECPDGVDICECEP